MHGPDVGGAQFSVQINFGLCNVGLLALTNSVASLPFGTSQQLMSKDSGSGLMSPAPEYGEKPEQDENAGTSTVVLVVITLYSMYPYSSVSHSLKDAAAVLVFVVCALLGSIGLPNMIRQEITEMCRSGPVQSRSSPDFENSRTEDQDRPRTENTVPRS